MTTAQGYVLFLSPDRMKAFEECLQDGRYRFGEPVPNFPHNRYAPLICFVVNEGKVIHITIGTRGRQNQAGSGLSPLKIDRSEPLKTLIPLDQLLENVPKKNKSFILAKIGGQDRNTRDAEFQVVRSKLLGRKSVDFQRGGIEVLTTNPKLLRACR